jgi:Aminoacyl-tRNA editing domain
MNLQRDLWNDLRLRFRRDVRNEPTCSCGAADHACMHLFRVDGQPVTVVVPEAYELSAARFSRALGGARVEPMSAAELDLIFSDTELGHTGPFENPFGAAVYLDENLLQFETLVFCPKMFNDKRGECFRVATVAFRKLTNPVVLRVCPPFQPISESKG